MKPSVHKFSHAPGLKCHRPARSVTRLSDSVPTESFQPSSSSNTKVWKFATLAGLALTGVALSGCNQPGVEIQDVVVNSGRIQTDADHFETLPGRNHLSTTLGAHQDGGRGGRFDDPHQRDLQAGSRYLGAIEARDGAGFNEIYQIHGADGMLLHIEQLEVRTGIITDRNEETLTASFRGRQPIVRIIELETSGFAGLNNQDVETIHYLSGGQDTSVARVEEHVRNNETVRYGTTIDTDFNGQPFKVETKSGYFGLWNNWLGSSVKVNGEHAYNVDVKWSLGLVSESQFEGYTIKRADGTVAAEVEINTDNFRYQDAYDIRALGRDLGTIYMVDNSEPATEGQPQTIFRSYGVRLEGKNDAEKLENLKMINLVLALMPDQINMNEHNLAGMEESLDSALFVLTNEGKTAADDQTREAAVAVATEEDSMTIARAIDTLIFNPAP